MSRLLLYRLRRKDYRRDKCLCCQFYYMPDFSNAPYDNGEIDFFDQRYNLVLCDKCFKKDNIIQICRILNNTDARKLISLVEYCCRLDLIDIFLAIKLYTPYTLSFDQIDEGISFGITVACIKTYKLAKVLIDTLVNNNSKLLCRALCNVDIGFSKIIKLNIQYNWLRDNIGKI